MENENGSLRFREQRSCDNKDRNVESEKESFGRAEGKQHLRNDTHTLRKATRVEHFHSRMEGTIPNPFMSKKLKTAPSGR